MLNLACSGRTDAAFLRGKYYDLVGDSGSGKTWLLLQTLAEACADPRFDSHRLILDQPEQGANMDVARYFGARLRDRLENPFLGRPSRFLEEFYDQVGDAIASGGPFIYGLDSEDALAPWADILKMDADKAARRKSKTGEAEVAGSMGMGRAKLNSTSLRVVHNALKMAGSLLFVIKQTRDAVGFGSQFHPKTKSGGNAITFYSTVELWFSIKGEIHRTVNGKPRIIGDRIRCRVEKNRLNGRDRTVDLLFYPTVGFDDVGSICLFLVEEGHWEGKAERGKEISSVTAPEFKHEGKMETLVEKIEAEGREGELRLIVKDVWDDLERRCSVSRKPRYS